MLLAERCSGTLNVTDPMCDNRQFTTKSLQKVLFSTNLNVLLYQVADFGLARLHDEWESCESNQIVGASW